MTILTWIHAPLSNQNRYIALLTFVNASYEEDPYGQIQSIVPSSFDLIAQIYSGLKSYKQEMSSSAESNGGEAWKRHTTAIVNEEIQPIIDSGCLSLPRPLAIYGS